MFQWDPPNFKYHLHDVACSLFPVTTVLHSYSTYGDESPLDTMHNPRLKSIDAAFVVQKCILYLGVTQIIIWQDNKTHGCNTFCDCSCICYLHCLSHISLTKLPHVCLWEGPDSWFNHYRDTCFIHPSKKFRGWTLTCSWAVFAWVWYLLCVIHCCHFEICDMFITDVESLNVFNITEVGD